ADRWQGTRSSTSRPVKVLPPPRYGDRATRKQNRGFLPEGLQASRALPMLQERTAPSIERTDGWAVRRDLVTAAGSGSGGSYRIRRSARRVKDAEPPCRYSPGATASPPRNAEQ